MLFPLADFDRTLAMLAAPRQAPNRAVAGFADLHVGEDELALTVDLPGVRDEDLELTLQHDVLTLTAKREVAAPEGQRAQLRERRGFDITRRFALPVSVDPEKVNATLRDGVLTVTLAKAESARPRTITIAA